MKRNGLTVVLADRDVEDAKRLLALLTRAGARRRITHGGQQVYVVRNELPEVDQREKLALAMFAVREAREELLRDSLSGEPAWDIFLAVYLAHKGGVRHNIGRMIELSRSSMTTGLRHIDNLEAEGLVEREQDPRDGRIVYLTVSRKGLRMMDKILSAAFSD